MKLRSTFLFLVFASLLLIGSLASAGYKSTLQACLGAQAPTGDVLRPSVSGLRGSGAPLVRARPSQ